MSEERCETCRFWKFMPEYDEDGNVIQETDPDSGNWGGACRRYPPQLTSFFALRDCGTDEEKHVRPYESTFPFSWGSAWCGEYRPIGEKSDVEAK